MTAGIESSFEYTNLQGLSALKNAGGTPEAQRAVAQQFESLFLSMMLQQMRAASSMIDGGLIDNEKLEFHQSMFDQQLALTLSQGRGIGLADSILRSIGGGQNVPTSGSRAFGLASFNGPGTTARLSSNEAPAPVDTAKPVVGLPEFAAGSPSEFVSSIWPHAETAARKLGIEPDVLVAQAALETGWGRHLPVDHYGESSLNLFGIKAGPDWAGRRAVISTLEFVDGTPERRFEPFRMYSSVDESFDDYVEFVRGKPRYSEAVNAQGAEAYAKALQQAGYATDPAYAEKIIGILRRGLPGRNFQPGMGQEMTTATDKYSSGRPETAAGDLERL